MRNVVLALSLTWLASCSPDSESARLAGRWAVDGESCDRSWLTYREDGSWVANPGGGRWRLERGKLTLQLTEDGYAFRGPKKPIEPNLCHTEHIEWIGPNEYRTRWEDGTVHRLTRCVVKVQPTIGCLGDCNAVTPFHEHGWAERAPAARRAC
jgi:hypothetical protein